LMAQLTDPAGRSVGAQACIQIWAALAHLQG
jgi:hypothetical protein